MYLHSNVFYNLSIFNNMMCNFTYSIVVIVGIKSLTLQK